MKQAIFKKQSINKDKGKHLILIEKTKEYYWKKGNSMMGYNCWENNKLKIKNGKSKKINRRRKNF